MRRERESRGSRARLGKMGEGIEGFRYGEHETNRIAKKHFVEWVLSFFFLYLIYKVRVSIESKNKYFNLRLYPNPQVPLFLNPLSPWLPGPCIHMGLNN